MSYDDEPTEAQLLAHDRHLMTLASGVQLIIDPTKLMELIDLEQVRTAVILNAASVLVDDIYRAVRSKDPDAQTRAAARAAVQAEISQVARDRATELIGEVLLEQVQETNSFSETTGKSKPMREFVMDTIRAELARPVNDSYSNQKRPRMIDSVVASLVREQVTKELAAVAKEELAAAKQMLHNAVVDQVAAQLQRTKLP